jgi:glycogen debranching enzyme
VSIQPRLHDLIVTVCAPTSALSGADGQIRAAGVQGVFHADTRVLAQALVRLDGREPEPLGHAVESAARTRFVAVARWLGHPGVRVDRVRSVSPGRLEEVIEISSSVAVTTTVTVDLVVDPVPLAAVRAGASGPPEGWSGAGVTVTTGGDLSRTVEIGPGRPAVLGWELTIDDSTAVISPPVHAQDWSRPTVQAADRRLGRLVDRSLDDLHALRLSDGGDTFLAAGVPWYLTLFGRDSLWAARMLLPLGTELAAGTLRVLGRRQGRRHDPETGEAPGKIMHELRQEGFALGGTGLRLPPVYYGTIDATLLWISLLHDAWRWGLAEDQVAALLPALEAALGWLDDQGEFLAYRDASGHGLANQGWKDSGDAVRFRDGRIAAAPIALVEVQGYAHRAALDGADLLDAFGRPGGDHRRAYANGLADRFRARFWVDEGYPALGLDGDGRPVDALTSNIGHLLGSGLLNADEEQAVAGALATEAMSGGYGLRTMAADNGGYDPLSYHCGTVWAHDTAIVTAGLARAGFTDLAATLIDGLLAAGESFDYRLPELHSGDARADFDRPMPYPSACRPQAWAAAAAISLVQSTLGLYPDVPNGVVELRPLAPISVTGLVIAGRRVDITTDSDGTAAVDGLPAGLSI